MQVAVGADQSAAEMCVCCYVCMCVCVARPLRGIGPWSGQLSLRGGAHTKHLGPE